DADAGDEPGDAFTVVGGAPPDLSLAGEHVPVLVDRPEVTGAAHHPGRHGRVDHVAVCPVHQRADVGPQGRAAVLRRFEAGRLHVRTYGEAGSVRGPESGYRGVNRYRYAFTWPP